METAERDLRVVTENVRGAAVSRAQTESTDQVAVTEAGTC